MPGVFVGVYAPVVPNFFLKLAELVADAMVSETISPLDWKSVTNKSVYTSHAKYFEIPKVEQEAGVSLKKVWTNLCSSVLCSSVRETIFLFIHNKLPTKERLARIQVADNPYCSLCLVQTGGLICDREHVFISCPNISELWKEIRLLIDPLLLQKNIDSLQLLMLNFSGGKYEAEIIWLIGNYMQEVWSTSIRKGRAISRAELFGFLKFKFKSDQLGARFKMQTIPNL